MKLILKQSEGYTLLSALNASFDEGESLKNPWNKKIQALIVKLEKELAK